MSRVKNCGDCRRNGTLVNPRSDKSDARGRRMTFWKSRFGLIARRFVNLAMAHVKQMIVSCDNACGDNVAAFAITFTKCEDLMIYECYITIRNDLWRDSHDSTRFFARARTQERKKKEVNKRTRFVITRVGNAIERTASPAKCKRAARTFTVHMFSFCNDVTLGNNPSSGISTRLHFSDIQTSRFIRCREARFVLLAVESYPTTFAPYLL